jgi:hypothetical protein
MRFSIRDVFWVTALAAMGLGWWMDSQSKAYTIECHKVLQDAIRARREVPEDELRRAVIEAWDGWEEPPVEP